MKKIIILILCIFISFVASIISYAQKTTEDLSNNIFRLHIIANSDDEYDQNIKLIVRDNVLKYLSNKSLNFININETIKYFNDDLENIKNIVSNSLKINNYNLPYTITIDKSYFPTKQYNNISLPPGKYNCLKICIGESSGKNWWCVLYPNLCSTDLSVSLNSKKQLEKSLNKDSYEIINNNISYKFKIIEFINNLQCNF